MKSSARQIVQTLREHGFTAFFAGGCVRDMLMGKKPDDYDIVTDASPEQVRKIFKRTVPVGMQFGIILVVIKGKPYEIAQFRDTSHPETQLQDDARHRDFTINGMFYDPLTKEVFDYVGGQEDIQRRCLRGVEHPLERIKEDKLRMMRAARFAASFEYTLEPDTESAIRQFAPDILEVSAERLREELVKILLSRHPDQGIRLLDVLSLLEQILPEVTAMKDIPQPPDHHPEGDVFTHTLLMLRQMRSPSPELAMAVLLHDVGKPKTYTCTDRIHFYNHAKVGAEMAAAICHRLKCSNKSTDEIVTLVGQHLKFYDVDRMKTSTLKRFFRQEHFPNLLELHRLDCVGSNGELRYYEFCKKKFGEIQQESMRPPLLISGKDLLELGLSPGPVFKRVLNAVEDAQLEGTVSTREQAIDYATTMLDTG